MKKVRVLGLLLVMTLLVSVLASCNNGKTGNSKGGSGEKKYDLGGRTVTLAHWSDLTPNESSPTYAEQMQLIEDIESKYNCRLDFFTTNDWHSYMSVIQITALSGEQISDAFWAGFSYLIPTWVNSDLIVPLDNYFDFSDKTWNQSMNDEWSLNGKHYGISNWRDALGHVILFNKRICAENGITDSYLYDLQKKGEWTWDKLREFAIKCTKDTDNDGENDVFGFGSYGTCPTNPEPFVYANGASPVTVDKDFHYHYNLNDPRVIEAIQYCYDLYWVDQVSYMGSTDWGTWEGLWRMGNTAFYSVASWNMFDYPEDLEDDEIGVLLIPKGPSAEDYVNAQSAPSGIFIQPMVQDKEAIAAIMTDFHRDYDWRLPNDAASQWKNWVFDDNSLESIDMVNGRTVSLMGEVSTYFRDNVLWSDWGIKSQTNPRSFVESMKAPCQASFDELWKSVLTLDSVTTTTTHAD